MAQFYRGKSVAEQNSVDLAWTLFVDPRFVDLRQVVCATPAERSRLRQLVVNSVMATDIMDKELGAARKARWNKAFADDTSSNDSNPLLEEEDTNRKATIVIEHIIQASDVAHTMQ